MSKRKAQYRDPDAGLPKMGAIRFTGGSKLSDTDMSKAFQDEYERAEHRRPPQTPLPRALQLEDEIYIWNGFRNMLLGPYVAHDIEQLGPRFAFPDETRLMVCVWQSKAHREHNRLRFYCWSEGHGEGALQWRLAEELSEEEKAKAHMPPFDRPGNMIDPDSPEAYPPLELVTDDDAVAATAPDHTPPF